MWDASRDRSDVAPLDGLLDGETWGGPLVVSLPRTGSTLLGTLFLLLHDPPGSGEHVFRRYIHEPVAPVFWEGRSLASVKESVVPPLTERDIIQESAYQFTAKPVAEWFLHHAKKPIAFAVRHPRLTWPSRWRILLSEKLATDPGWTHASRAVAALEADDYSAIGDVLLETIRPLDNGWLAMLSLIGLCRREGIEHVLVDNGRFRHDPDAVLSQLCKRWGLPYDSAMTDWSNLSEAMDRVTLSSLARGPEYEWYYAGTFGSRDGIVRTDRPPHPLERFPDELRGFDKERFTIDKAAQWYEELIANSEVLG